VAGDAFDELDFEYATSVAEKAVGSMSPHRVPPTPEQFSHLVQIFRWHVTRSQARHRYSDRHKRKFDTTTNRDLFAM